MGSETLLDPVREQQTVMGSAMFWDPVLEQQAVMGSGTLWDPVWEQPADGDGVGNSMGSVVGGSSRR